MADYRHALRWLRAQRPPSRPTLPSVPLLYPELAAILAALPEPEAPFFASLFPVEGGSIIFWELRDNYQGLAGLVTERAR